MWDIKVQLNLDAVSCFVATLLEWVGWDVSIQHSLCKHLMLRVQLELEHTSFFIAYGFSGGQFFNNCEGLMN